MSKQVTTRICYLTPVEIDSGRAAKQGDGYYVNGRFIPRVPTRVVEPTTVAVTVSDSRIASINATWGDRVKRGETPVTYGTLSDGTRWNTYLDGSLGLDGAPDVDDALYDAICDTLRQVADAWLAAIASRPDVAAVVEDYRATVLDRLDREYADHYAQWEADALAIARKFGRKWVQVGEQTVPGKCCVRGAHGALLGYAIVREGKWLGKVERA